MEIIDDVLKNTDDKNHVLEHGKKCFKRAIIADYRNIN